MATDAEALCHHVGHRQHGEHRHRRGKHFGVETAQYWSLVVMLLGANIIMLSALTGLGLSLLSAKVITEFVLFILSFRIQRRFVFARSHANELIRTV